MRSRSFAAGDWGIYRKLKQSRSPGPRAEDVTPAEKGETYTYVIKKFWIVQEVLLDARLKVRTRRGKSHLIEAADPNLRRVPWWQKWFYRKRFLLTEQSTIVE